MTDSIIDYPDELWKEIDDFPGYHISNYGRVRSKKHNNKLLICRPNHAGYMKVCMYKCGDLKGRRVSRLVAKAFIPNPLNKPQVNHIDGFRDNDKWINLEWVTSSENSSHSIHTLKTKLTPRRAFRPVIATKGDKVLHFPSIVAAWKAGFDRGQIMSCCRGRKHYHTHRGYKWKYADTAGIDT